MPVLKKYNDKFSFKVTHSGTEYHYPGEYFVFLKENILVETFTDDDGNDHENHWGIVENSSYGLMWWQEEEAYWEPVPEVVQKAYSDFIAEKLLLGGTMPAPTKSKKKQPS